MIDPTTLPQPIGHHVRALLAAWAWECHFADLWDAADEAEGAILIAERGDVVEDAGDQHGSIAL